MLQTVMWIRKLYQHAALLNGRRVSAAKVGMGRISFNTAALRPLTSWSFHTGWGIWWFHSPFLARSQRHRIARTPQYVNTTFILNGRYRPRGHVDFITSLPFIIDGSVIYLLHKTSAGTSYTSALATPLGPLPEAAPDFMLHLGITLITTALITLGPQLTLASSTFNSANTLARTNIAFAIYLIDAVSDISLIVRHTYSIGC
jgi:hypothetical protein